MSCSVVIPAFNAERYLRATVESALGQGGALVGRVIIVDDGSSDGTLGLAEQLAAESPQVIALHQINQGPSVARNRGLQEVSSEWVAFLDADDIWADDFLSVALASLGEHQADAFISVAERFRETPGDWGVSYGPSSDYAKALPASILSGIPFAPCMTVLRTDVARSIGGFRGGDVYWEDWDFWIRVAEAGARFCVHEARPLVYYRDTPGSRSEDARRCFGKSVATLDLHWSSSLASSWVKRRAKARYLRWIGKASEGGAERFHYFWRACLMAPWDLKNLACLAMSFSCTKK